MRAARRSPPRQPRRVRAPAVARRLRALDRRHRPPGARAEPPVGLLPSLEPPVSTNQAGGAVTETVGKAVTDTAGAVEGAVDDVTGSLPKLGG